MPEYYSRKKAEELCFSAAFSMRQFYLNYKEPRYARQVRNGKQMELLNNIQKCSDALLSEDCQKTVKRLDTKGFEEYYIFIGGLVESLNLHEKTLFRNGVFVTGKHLKEALDDTLTVTAKVEILEGLEIAELSGLEDDYKEKLADEIRDGRLVSREDKERQIQKLLAALDNKNDEYKRIQDSIFKIDNEMFHKRAYLTFKDGVNPGYSLPATPLALYTRMGELAKGEEYRAKYKIIPKTETEAEKEILVTYCNKFVYDMIGEFFGGHIRDKIFPKGCQLANDLYDTLAGNENLQEINVVPRTPQGQPDTSMKEEKRKEIINENIKKIQDMADAGVLIIVSFKVDTGHGHIALTGSRELILSTKKAERDDEGEKNTSFENKSGDISIEFLPVVVQAGTLSGTTSIMHATNNWTINYENLLANSIRFYKVKVR